MQRIILTSNERTFEPICQSNDPIPISSSSSRKRSTSESEKTFRDENDSGLLEQTKKLRISTVPGDTIFWCTFHMVIEFPQTLLCILWSLTRWASAAEGYWGPTICGNAWCDNITQRGRTLLGFLRCRRNFLSLVALSIHFIQTTCEVIVKFIDEEVTDQIMEPIPLPVTFLIKVEKYYPHDRPSVWCIDDHFTFAYDCIRDDGLLHEG